MSNGIGWHFPPTNGGRIDGYNDPGIAHFSGTPLLSLARETIQNSLDAQLAHDEPVHVSFELTDLTPTDIGRDELACAIAACKQTLVENPTAEAELTTAQEIIKRDRIPCLRISDRNTTGLSKDSWRALVKMQGVSYKPEIEGAGGSYGIGKYAPFAVSALRTVFYWTHFSGGDGNAVESFQGKAVLMSHESKKGETQGTGFFGVKSSCSKLSGKQIPQHFRVLGEDERPMQGTSLVIAGFRETKDWRRRIAASVIENFFYAISKNKLTVIVEPDESSDLYQIDNDLLKNWFDYLEKSTEGDDPGDEGANALREARTLWETSMDKPVAEKQDQDLGHCQLWIRIAEGLPRKVAFVRRTGMLVTTQQRNLIRFPGCQDFVALCVFEDPQGNELLRRMENPKHDQFEPDRLPENERGRGRRALKRITDWIRKEIRKHAGPPEGGKKTVLSELATYLPDFQPEEPFDDVNPNSDGTKEPGFGEQVTVTLRPVRRPRAPILPHENEKSSEEREGDGDDTGESGGAGTGSNGGEGGSGGRGEGGGEGGTGIRGGGAIKTRSIPISCVRILSIEGRENCYQLSFRAGAEGLARLDLEEAGDSSAVRRDDIRAVTDGVSLDRIPLTKGKRTAVEVTADAPISGRAWRLSAVANEGDSK